MNTQEEREAVEAILAKLEAKPGEALSMREWRILAYSPYGTAAGCPAAAPLERFLANIP